MPIDNLAIDLDGEYTFYENREHWLSKAKERGLTPWIIGQLVFGNHEEGRFRARLTEESAVAGMSLHLKIEGITKFAALAIVSGRLDGAPPKAFGKILVPFAESLDALIHVPEDAEEGTYVFFAQQWEPDGQPAYPGGSLIYPSSIASVRIRHRTDDETFWESFESWSENEAEAVRQSIRRMRTVE